MSLHVDRSEGVRLGGPIIVELAGPPGAGKTSIAPGVEAALRSSGWVTYSPVEGARRVVGRMPLGRLIGRLPSDALRRGLTWRAYVVHRLLGAGRVFGRHPVRFWRLLADQRRRPPAALARKRRVGYWLVRTMGAQEFFRRHAADGEAIVFDEGYVHRVVQLFSSPVGKATSDVVDAYMSLVPRPDLLVAVRCPTETCIERVSRRGVWERLADLSSDEIAAFISNSSDVVDHAVGLAFARGWRVVEVDNSTTESDLVAATAQHSVGMTVADLRTETSGRDRPLYRVRLPRPGRFVRTVKGRLSPIPIPERSVDVLLEQHGLKRVGRLVTLPLGRRSDSLWVDSDDGRLVVRAYSDHWLDETIRHEHSVLSHLADCGYPATRLLVAPDGATVHTVDGRRFSLFRFERGANLSGSFITVRAGLEALHLAGRLMARLHAETADLRPAGSHHLEMDDTDGRSRITSQLLTLDELAGAPSEHPDVELLREQVPAISKRLTELHTDLMEAEVSIAVIHGDFGLHNILLRRNGTAVVHDFELARRDWCMVDIVEMLTVLPLIAGRAFLAGYRFEAGGSPPDWRHLASMWEYHRLGGAIRSWESFVDRGDSERLTVARRRIEAAATVASEGVSKWL